MGNRGFYGFSGRSVRSEEGYWPVAYPAQGSNLLMWLSADQISGLNDGDAIASWPDNAGLVTVAQTNASYKPTYKTGIIAGALPVARFAYGNYMTVANLVIGANVTFMCVAYDGTQNSSGSIHKPLLAGVQDPYANGTSSWGFSYQREGSNGVNTQQSSSSLSFAKAKSNAFEVFTATKEPTTAKLFINSGQVAVNTSFTGVGGSTAGYWLGGQTSIADRRYTGDIAEMLVWSVLLTDDEREYMEQALKNKYGIS